MTIGSLFFAGLLAMAPNWAVVDIPYPEANGTGAETVPSASASEGQVWDALSAYARSRSAAPLRKSDIIVTKIDGGKATAKVTRGGKTEVVYLEYNAGEWKVVKTE